jgi:S-adenosylmethionine:tRNA ribosyltransferase-isomerase
MHFIPDINISEYNYLLPEEKIAQFPLSGRDESKLLIYINGLISQDIFKNISDHLPENSLLVFNETKVIQARLLFNKASGATIELFCLEPLLPTRELQLAFEQKSGVVWKCLVGNSRRWKSGKLQKSISSNGRTCILSAERLQQSQDQSFIRFEWEPSALSFSEILVYTGIIPLPPYMKREAIKSDAEWYQTIYARTEGSVAAPTAGLHFTEAVFQKLDQKKIDRVDLTLHVGVGTFKPVTQNEIKNHEMHFEKILIHKNTVQQILDHLSENITVVGTTSMRTVESLYWFGVKLMIDKKSPEEIDIKQWNSYDPIYNCEIQPKDSLMEVLNYMGKHSLETISGQTQLMIVPGYRFRIPNILITNFHMPKSTLLLLVSAFMGNGWKDAYKYALDHDFRFLSYGDACLFFKQDEE